MAVAQGSVARVSHYGGWVREEAGDGKVSRALVAAGLSGLALMVLAMMAAAGGAHGNSAAKPSAALQMRAAQQLRMSMLEQTEAQKEEARRFLDQGAYDFSFTDNSVPSAETGETMVHKAPPSQILHLSSSTSLKADAAARLAAKKARLERPRHLQGRSQIRLGLGDDKVLVGTAVRDVGVPRQTEVRADPLSDVVVQAHYPLQ